MRFVVAGPSMAAALLCTRFSASPAERVREDVYSLRRGALPAADGKNLLESPAVSFREEMAVIEPRELKTSGTVTLLFHDPAAGRVGPMRVFAFLPPAATRKELTSVLFVVHGVRRNAEDAFQQALSAVDCQNCVLLVPEFSTQHFPGIWGFNYGNIADGEEAARLRPREQ